MSHVEKTSEAQLYAPLAAFFTAQGFSVKGEVCGADLVAVKGETIVIAELKISFNIKLLYQAVRRLQITPLVYAAIFYPPRRQKMSYWQMMKSLCRRLNIGMLMVRGDRVEVFAEPAPFQSKVTARHKNKLLKEFHGRRVSENTGGVTGVKLNTAYLESAVHISVLLHQHKILPAKELVALGTTEKTHSILYANHYGWFSRASVGKYKLKTGVVRQIKRQHEKIWLYYSNLA